MPFAPTVKLTGFAELERYLTRLPATAATRLQKVETRNHLDHRKEIVRRSTFSGAAKQRIGKAITVWPRGKPDRKRIRDVEAGTSSFWRGDVTTVGEGVAARVEKRIGKSTTRPTRKRYLLIPWGDFLTPTGRPRRERRDIGGRSVMAPVLIRDLPGTRVAKIAGKLRVIQRLEPGARGRFESGAKGTTKKTRGVRERIVGILVREARVVRGLDFFGSWEGLERVRNDRYDRMLLDVLK